MSTEELAFAFVAATKKRAQARSHLSALRRKWQDEGGEYFSEEECRGELGYDEMMAALKAREDCNTEYRRAKGRLFRACAAPLPAAAPKSGETPMDAIRERMLREGVGAAAMTAAEAHESFGRAADIVRCTYPACPEGSCCADPTRASHDASRETPMDRKPDGDA